MNKMNVKFCKALADFQQEVSPVHEASKNDFAKYTYAGLPAIFKVINPLLKKHGLGFTQIVNGTSLTTILFHVESGETLESVMDIPQGVTMKGMNDFQVMGSSLTYLRRYQISGILGLVTDSDMDAAGEQTSPRAAAPPAKKKETKAKGPMSDEVFAQALEAVLAGKRTKQQLMAKFILTPEQIKKFES